MNEGKKYTIIYADPPWEYKVWSEKGKGRSAEKHYRTQGLDFLKNLRISDVTAENSVLLMWATFPCLLQAIALGQSWGFTYKTVAFTWVKKNRHVDSLFMGMGYYTRSNAEVVLLFTKGKPLARQHKGVAQVLISARQEHSRKPDAIRRRIVQLFGNQPRLEMFARQPKSSLDYGCFRGWDVFGDQIENSIVLPY